MPPNGDTSSLAYWFDKLEGKAAIKSGLTAAFSLIAGIEFSRILEHPDSLVSGLWCVFTAIVVLQACIGETYRAAYLRFLGVLVGSIIGSIFTSLIGSNAFLLGVSIASTVSCCALLNIKDSLRIANLSVAVIMLLASKNPAISPWTFGLFRFLDSCLGIAIAMFFAHAIWPTEAMQKVRHNLSQCLGEMNRLFRRTVMLLTPSQDLTSHELSIKIAEMIQNSRRTVEESKFELIAKEVNLDDWKLLISIQENLFENILTLKDIHKEQLSILIDDSLTHHLDHLIEKIDNEFHELEVRFENKIIQKDKTTALEDALSLLQKDLLRFRATKTTRKFDLQDVEAFFVFFYTIVSIAKLLPKFEQAMNKIIQHG